MKNFCIRTLPATDADQIHEIELAAHQHPWSKSLIDQCFTKNHLILGAYDGEQLLGYLILSYVMDEATLLNLCVSPTCRRQGIAKKLMQTLPELMQKHDLQICFLEVRASNHAAINLYQQFLFQETGFRKNYYPCDDGSREDAVLMQR